MKNYKLFTLLIVLLCATAIWAQPPGAQKVYNETDLRNAVKSNAIIWFKADITLSSALVIDVNGTVGIELNGHTLNRGLTKRGDNGQVISVRSGSTLTLGGGTLTGGWGGNSGGILNGGIVNLMNVTITGCTGDDRGGGISNSGTLTMTGGSITNNTSNDNIAPKGGGGLFNAEGATATLTGVTITGNEAKVYDGGGISNYGTLTLNGCNIQNNTANNTGSGIWCAASGTLNMKGTMTVTNNTKTDGLADNVYLKNGAIINVANSLTGSNIGISMEHPGTFTSDYSTYNSGIAPNTIFTPDIPSLYQVTLSTTTSEAFLTEKGSLYCIEGHWDDTNKQVVNTTKVLYHWIDNNLTPSEGDYKEVTNGGGTFVLGGYNNDIHEYYMVRGNVNRTAIDVQGRHVHIILCDGATLTVPNGILLYGEHRLYIHSQSFGSSMGKLIAGSAKVKNTAGIGGDGDDYGIYPKRKIGRLEVHGGDIKAEGGEDAAGIGGGLLQAGDLVIVYGGRVEARGGDNGAGIGGGQSGSGDGGYFGHGGKVNVYGGSVYAYGGGAGSGIGGSANGLGGYFTIYGGYVEARGDWGCAGIGSGCNQDYDVFTGTFNGGTVKAWGGKNGAGIGSGNNSESNGIITVNGGKVYAYGGDDGAGIGGGWDSNGTKVTINDGYVYAKGGGNGSGIGSGSESTYFSINGGKLTITGGEVYAYGGVDAAGIGGGEDADGGTVNISGGYVYAEGNDYGSGIGGGQDAKGANVTITGGTVIAKAGRNETGMRAIGPGEGCDDYGSLTLGDDRCVYITSNLWRSQKANRVSDCWGTQYLQISECLHGDATASVVNGDKHSISNCKWCYTTGEETHTFRDYGECDACHLISLANDADNSNILAHWNNTAKSVTFSGRTLKKNNSWNTLCLPFSLASLTGTPLADATVKTLNSTAFASGTLTMNFTEDANNLTSIEAGKPYIVKWTSGSDITDPVFTNVTISNTTSNVETENVDFIGIYSPKAITGEDKSILYLGADNKLYYPSAAMTINACRAYFKLKGITAGDVAEARMFFGDGMQTGISPAEIIETAEKANAWYTLDGRKLQGKPTTKGVYIYNGRKLVVK